MNRNFDDILDECLERLSSGETVDACLRIYPDEAERLAPMLTVAQATMRAATSIEPRSDFKAQALYRISREMGKPHKSRGWLQRLPRFLFTTPLLLGLGSLFIVFGGAVGVSAASSSSLPGDPLYPVKTTKEWVMLNWPQSEMSKARLEAELAQTREEEIGELAQRGEMDKVGYLTRELNQHLQAAAYLVISIPQSDKGDVDAMMLRSYLKEKYQEHEMMMQTSMQNAPSTVRPILRQSWDQSGQMFEQAITELGEGSGVFIAVNPNAGYVIFKPAYGRPVFLELNNNTKIYLNNSEGTLSSLYGYNGSTVSVVFDPITRQAQEIHITQ